MPGETVTKEIWPSLFCNAMMTAEGSGRCATSSISALPAPIGAILACTTGFRLFDRMPAWCRAFLWFPTVTSPASHERSPFFNRTIVLSPCFCDRTGPKRYKMSGLSPGWPASFRNTSAGVSAAIGTLPAPVGAVLPRSAENFLPESFTAWAVEWFPIMSPPWNFGQCRRCFYHRVLSFGLGLLSSSCTYCLLLTLISGRGSSALDLVLIILL